MSESKRYPVNSMDDEEFYGQLNKLIHLRLAAQTDALHRILSGAPITPNELRLAGLFALIWFLMDVFWFLSTFFHWFGL